MHDALRDFAPQSRSFQDVGLVDRGQLAPPAKRQFTGHTHDALDLGNRIAAQIAGRIAAAGLGTEIDATGQFAHEYQIDAVQNLGLQS